MPGNSGSRTHVLGCGPGRRFIEREYKLRRRRPVRSQRFGVHYWIAVRQRYKPLLSRPVSIPKPRPARERIDPKIGAEVYRRCLDMVWFYTWVMPDAYARERWEAQLEKWRRYAEI